MLGVGVELSVSVHEEPNSFWHAMSMHKLTATGSFCACCRDCGNDGDASDHISDDLGDSDCVATQHSDCSVLLLCLWLN